MKRLMKYLTIAFLITWICWWGEALFVKFTSFRESDLLPMILFTVGGFGPTIAALCCFENKLTPKRIINFLFGCKKNSFFILIFFLVLEIATFGLSSMQRNAAIEFSTIPMIFAQAIFIYGGNEELGWRGVMQSVLQKKLPYPIATLIVGVVWSMWHIPLWFIEGNSHQGSSFIAFALLAILLSFWLSAIINSHGSIFWCMILHGATNTLLSIFVIKMNWVLIIGLVLLTTLSLIISLVQLKKTQDKV
jgi:membrane protease YdiL (CAAX protease family)